MKKVMSWVLLITMCLSLMPSYAFATEDEDIVMDTADEDGWAAIELNDIVEELPEEIDTGVDEEIAAPVEIPEDEYAEELPDAEDATHVDEVPAVSDDPSDAEPTLEEPEEVIGEAEIPEEEAEPVPVTPNNFSISPVGQNNISVPYGQSVTLEVIAKGNDLDGVTYSWYGDYELNADRSANTYTINEVVTSASYWCSGTDKYGNYSSVYFSVSVDNKLIASAVGDPSVAVPYASAVLLQVTVSAENTDGITYQWYQDVLHSEDWGNWYSQEPIEGATVSRFAPVVTERVTYACKVKDQYNNSCWVYFYVSVENNLTVSAAGETNITVPYGESTTLEVIASASNLEGISYTWYIGSGDFYPDTQLSQGSNMLTVSVTERAQYRCLVIDRFNNSKEIFFAVHVDNNLSVEAVGESDRTVSLGDSVTLQVCASANQSEGITYQWYNRMYEEYDSGGFGYYYEEIAGANNEVYSFTAVSASRLYCLVTDQFGNYRQVYFSISIDNNFKVSPVGSANRYVQYGDTATLQVSVSADDMEGITYRWYTNGQLLPGVAGNTCTTDEIRSQTSYHCDVTDLYGNTFGISFWLSIDNNLLAEPVGERTHYLQYGESATLEVSVSAKNLEGITYRWYKDGQPLYSETESTCRTDAVVFRAHYYCTVTDCYGNSSWVFFWVYVDNNLLAEPLGPTNRSLQPGQSAVLEVSVSANDMEGITYQWYKNDLLVPDMSESSCTTDEIYSQTYYNCRVVDRFGNTSYVHFWLNIDNGLTIFPVNGNTHRVSYGASETLAVSVSANDDEGLSYQWYEIVAVYENDVTYYMDNLLIEGEIGPTFNTPAITTRKVYNCQVQDKYGNSRSTDFYVMVDNGLAVEPRGSTWLAVTPQSRVTFGVNASANDMEGLTYQWAVQRRSMTEYGYSYQWTTLEGANSDSYTTEPITESGTYQCLVTDKYGNTASIRFTAQIDNNLYIFPIGNRIRYLEYGQPTTLEVMVSADDMDDISIKWSRMIDDGQIRNATTTLELGPVTKAEQYLCNVTDKFGNTVSTIFFVYVQNHFTVTRVGAAERSVSYGEDVTLAVVATADSTEGITYSWQGQIDGSDGSVTIVSLGNTSELTLENVTRAAYAHCTVTDKYGTTVHLPFIITVGSDASSLPSVRIDREYLVVKPGTKGIPLTATTGIDALDSNIVWHVEDELGRIDTSDAIITVDEFGTVHAVGKGTAYAVAEVIIGSHMSTARCRIDVLDEEMQGGIEFTASLLNTKYTTEIRSTNYTTIPVVLGLIQNQMSIQSETTTQEITYTVPMIREASFKSALPFTLRVRDDRTLEVIPAINVADDTEVKGVKGSYKSAIIIELSNGQTITLPEITLSVKKSLPKLKAANIKLNRFVTGDSAVVSITGGNVTSYAVKADSPAVASIDQNFKVTVNNSATKNGTGRITLYCTLEDWVVPADVTFTVSTVYTAPKVTLNPASVAINPTVSDVAKATCTIVSLPGMSHKLSIDAGNSGLMASYESGAFVITRGTAKSGTYKLPVLADGKQVAALTVKVLGNVTPTVTVKATGAIDAVVDNSPVTLTVTGKNYNAWSCGYKATILQTSKKNGIVDADRTDLFNIHWSGTVATITGTSALSAYVKDYTYTALVTPNDSSIAAAKPVRIAVKASVKAPKPTMTLKATGSIDVLRWNSSEIIITPTYKNWYGHDLTEATFTYESDLFYCFPAADRLFITMNSGAKANTKVAHTITVSFPDGPSATVKIPVKVGTAKVTANTKAITLSSNDKYDRGRVVLTLSDPELSIDHIDLVDKKGYFQKFDVSEGVVEIGFKKNVPAAIMKAKSSPVQLEVYLTGSTVKNATVSVTVNLR